MAKQNQNYKDIIVGQDFSVDEKTKIRVKITDHPEKGPELKIWTLYPKKTTNGEVIWEYSTKGITISMPLVQQLRDRIGEVVAVYEKLQQEEAAKKPKKVTITPELSAEFAAFLEFKAAAEAKKAKKA